MSPSFSIACSRITSAFVHKLIGAGTVEENIVELLSPAALRSASALSVFSPGRSRSGRPK
jgi:hypothetical protein